MRKIITWVITLALAMPTWADDYNKLTFEQNSGNKTTITSVGTVITFDGNTLTAVNGDEQCTLTLSELRKMFFTSGATGLLGDANNDGEVNISDVMLTVDYSMGQTTENFHFELADIDGNGEISVADIMGIVGIIMGT